MTEATAGVGADESRDWRLSFGLLVTGVWLALGFFYIANVVGWLGFARQSAPDLGGFLEGAFAPLAFLWLVIGFFLQQRELRHNNRAIRMQYEMMRTATQHAEVQARAISANELHQRQETFLLVTDRVQQQLAAVVGMLWMSSQATGEEGGADEREVWDLWSRVGAGDSDVFARRFLGLYYRRRGEGLGARDLFFGTEIRTGHSETILRTFNRLLESARQCDPDGIITDKIVSAKRCEIPVMNVLVLEF